VMLCRAVRSIRTILANEGDDDGAHLPLF
jgi:hypothetical protein